MTTRLEEPMDDGHASRDTDAHLADETFAALADGAHVLADAAAAHLATCDVCTGKLIDAAELSVATGELLRTHVHLAPETRALPWRAVAIAVVLSLCGLAPVVGSLPLAASRFAPSLAHAVPVLAHGASLGLARLGAGLAYAMTAASAFILLSLGVAVSRAYGHQGVAS